MFKSRLRDLFLWTLGICATLQFVRYYVVSTTFYLDMSRYLTGHERLPFQERVLPIFLMWPINHSTWLMEHFSHTRGGFDSASASSPDKLAFYIVSLVSFSIAAFCVHRLYKVVAPNGSLASLVFPLFMVLTLWTYVVHIDANFSYPYDMPSLAFFAGGLLAIYTRRFWPLATIVFIGTFNRETTLFLIGIYILDSASVEFSEADLRESRGSLSFRTRFVLRQVVWTRVLLLSALWLVVRVALTYHFRFNDSSENFVRLWGNIGRLRPRLWPTLFNVCGYTLPVVLVLRNRLRPLRFANYLYILPFWIAIMFYTGVILETRIYGELCSFVAVASVLLVEDAVRRKVAVEEHESSSPKGPTLTHTPADPATSPIVVLSNPGSERVA